MKRVNALVNGLLLWAIAQGNINIALRNNQTVESWCVERHSARKTWIDQVRLKQNYRPRSDEMKSRTGEMRNVTR